jgi:hypothetical protein
VRIVESTNAAAADSEVVPVDVSRVQAKVRREGVLLRRLMQMRTFVGEESQQQQLETNIAQCRHNLEVLDRALQTHKLTRIEARRLDILAVAPSQSAPQTAVVQEKKEIVVNDALPVYLQPPPQRAPAPRTQSPPIYVLSSARPRTAGPVRVNASNVEDVLPIYLNVESERRKGMGKDLFSANILHPADTSKAGNAQQAHRVRPATSAGHRHYNDNIESRIGNSKDNQDNHDNNVLGKYRLKENKDKDRGEIQRVEQAVVGDNKSQHKVFAVQEQRKLPVVEESAQGLQLPSMLPNQQRLKKMEENEQKRPSRPMSAAPALEKSRAKTVKERQNAGYNIITNA